MKAFVNTATIRPGLIVALIAPDGNESPSRKQEDSEPNPTVHPGAPGSSPTRKQEDSVEGDKDIEIKGIEDLYKDHDPDGL